MSFRGVSNLTALCDCPFSSFVVFKYKNCASFSICVNYGIFLSFASNKSLKGRNRKTSPQLSAGTINKIADEMKRRKTWTNNIQEKKKKKMSGSTTGSMNCLYDPTPFPSVTTSRRKQTAIPSYSTIFFFCYRISVKINYNKRSCTE